MQVYSGNGFKLGAKSKSNMAEFSKNPDERKKAEVSYQDHMNRIKEEDSNHSKYRTIINKVRHEKGLETFIDQNFFDEIIEECEFEKEQLQSFLITYDLNLDIDENISRYKPIVTKKITVPIIDINDFPAIEINSFMDLLNMKYSEFKKANSGIDNKKGIGNVYNVKLISVSDKDYITYQRILILTWRYYKQYSMMRQKKLIDIIDQCDTRIEKFSPLKRQKNNNSFSNGHLSNFLDDIHKQGIDRRKPNYQTSLKKIEDLKGLCKIVIEKFSK